MTRSWPTPWSWQGATALVLALALGLGWAVGVVVLAIGGASPGEAQLAELLNGIGQVLAGALGAYLGFTAALHHRAQPEPPTGRTAPPGE